MVELQDIEVINMNDSQYGKELNDRLQAIDSNFDALSSTDFLRGAQGETTGTLEITLDNAGNESLGLYIEKSGDQTEDILVTKTLILSQIVSTINGILSATYTENELLSQANSLGLINRKLVVFYKTTYINGQEKKYLVSSIPFVYYDPIYNSGIDTTDIANPEDLNDRSCVVAYNDQTQSFVAMHPFPQIYYDTEIGGGSLCWKINGQETSIPCQGPIGMTGSSSSLYIAYVKDTDISVDGLTLREIYGVVKPMPNANSGEGYTVTLIKPSVFGLNNIIMREGDAIICLPVSKTTEVSDGGTTIDRYNLVAPTFISNILINGSGNTKTYYAIAANGYINNLTPGNLNAGSHLFDSLDSIGTRTWGEGDAAIVPMGLFIPAKVEVEVSGSAQVPTVESYHMMWNDSTDDNSLNIGPVKDVAIASPSSVQSDKTLNIKYDTSKFKDIDATNIDATNIDATNIDATSITGNNAEISEKLTVNDIGASTVRVSDKIIGRDLDVSGSVNVGDSVNIDGDLYVRAELDVSGSVIAEGSVDVGNDLIVKGDAILNGNNSIYFGSPSSEYKAIYDHGQEGLYIDNVGRIQGEQMIGVDIENIRKLDLWSDASISMDTIYAGSSHTKVVSIGEFLSTEPIELKDQFVNVIIPCFDSSTRTINIALPSYVKKRIGHIINIYPCGFAPSTLAIKLHVNDKDMDKDVGISADNKFDTTVTLQGKSWYRIVYLDKIRTSVSGSIGNYDHFWGVIQI